MKARSPIFRNEPSPAAQRARIRRLFDWIDLTRIYQYAGRLSLDDVARIAGYSGREDSVRRQAERRYTELAKIAAEFGVRVYRRAPQIDEEESAPWPIVVDDVGRLEAAASSELGEPEVDDEEEVTVPRLGRRKTRVFAGLCARCPKPVSDRSRWLCDEHLASVNRRKRGAWNLRIKSGVCAACGGALDLQGKTRCSDCVELERRRAIQRAESLERRGRCVVCGQQSQAKTCDRCAADARSRVRKRQQLLKASSLCVSCGRRPVAAGRSVQYCEECAERLSDAARRRYATDSTYRQKRIEAKRAYERRLLEQGLCQRCGKNKVEAGRKTCRQCLDRIKKRDRAR